LINFISNLPRDLRSGGFSAMNAAACAALAKRYPLAYVGPIDPPTNIWEKGVSKALRSVGGRGDFAAYSQRRLTQIAHELERAALSDADLDFFHGLTPWSASNPRRPYVAWSDCTFRDYIDVFHRGRRFRADDLARIDAGEGRWLRRAARVLFTSEWAARRAIDRHRLDPARVGTVGIFGEIEPPERDAYAGRPQIAFISTDFAAKGGRVALDAFQRVRQRRPDAELVIVGASPASFAGAPGVTYAGYLRKEAPDEHRRFREILASSAAIVHPTRSDIAPLLLVEAAMFGCPVIASRAFAIPELVVDGETGVLVAAADDPDEIALAMEWMLEQPDGYRRLRANAWARARSELTRERFETRLLAHVESVLLDSAAAAA
jgi:glycosyltransferase involved in cell wall biosynthesis